MKTLLLFPLIALSILATSCSSMNPTQRIEKNAQAFNSLSARDQELIEAGKIRNGMSRDAVYLAWGKPAGKTEGQSQGKDFEKWTYTSITPVYHQSIYGARGFGYGYGSRYGRFGHGRGFNPYGSFGTEVSYVPYRSAWVKFQNGRVQSWQRGKAE